MLDEQISRVAAVQLDIRQGALHVVTALFEPGRSLEFVATFGGATFQHAGFGETFEAAPWAMFSTSSGGGLFARTNSGSASLDTLTLREREVMVGIVDGLMNKQIAHEIGVTEATVKAHRGQVMRKMRASSLAKLIRMADKLKLSQLKSKASSTKV